MAAEGDKVVKAQPDDSSLVGVGASAPSFRLKTTANSEFDLAAVRGKVVILNFFATWCGPCLQELPHIQKLWDEYKDRTGFALLVVGREETDDAVKAFMAKNKFSFPAAADPNRSAYGLYATKFIPRTYLIGADGKIAASSIGFRKEELEQMKSELERQLAGIR